MMSHGLNEYCEIIKQNINIVEFCEDQYNSVFIEGRNGWFNTHCLMPNHDDSNPSFGVNVETCSFNCFACGAKGSVIDLVMNIENMSLSHACSYLLNYLKIQPEEGSNKFYQLHKILRSKSKGIDKDVLLDAKIKSMKNQKKSGDKKEYFEKVIDIFEQYDNLNPEHFVKVLID